MVFGGGAFGRCLGYEGGAVGNGTSAHRVLRSPGKWGHRRQSFMKEEADPRETDLCGTMISDFSVPQIVGNTYLWLLIGYTAIQNKKFNK